MSSLHASTIIIINGVSSVGKTSVATNLQGLFSTPYLNFGYDMLIERMPKNFIAFNADTAGMRFNQEEESNEVSLSFGPAGMALLKAIPNVLKGLADAGNNIIVDISISPIDIMPDLITALQHHSVYFIALTAPLEVIEYREKERGDRIVGFARFQYASIHHNKQYDLMLDTSCSTPYECAQKIYEFILRNPALAFMKNSMQKSQDTSLS